MIQVSLPSQVGVIEIDHVVARRRRRLEQEQDPDSQIKSVQDHVHRQCERQETSRDQWEIHLLNSLA